MFRNPEQSLLDVVRQVYNIAFVLLGLERLGPAVARIRLAEVHAARHRAENVFPAVALRIGERARRPLRKVVVEGHILGGILGIDLTQPLYKQTIKPLGTALARFHDGDEVAAFADFLVQVDKLERLDGHGIMVAAVAAGGPALDRLFLLRQHGLEILVVGGVVGFREIDDPGKFLAQVVGPDRLFAAKRCGKGVQPVALGPQERTHFHLGYAVRPRGEIVSTKFHRAQIYH